MLMGMLKPILKLPTLQSVCTPCRRLIFGPAVRISWLQTSCYSTSKYFPKKHPQTSGTEGREHTTRLADPICSVSVKLLNSLMKRHENKFIMQPGISVPSKSLSALSTQDLVQELYNIPKDAPKKSKQIWNIEGLLMKRLYKMSLEQMIQACHGFYLQDHSFYRFLSQMLSVVDETFDDLSPSASEITHLLFYIFIHGGAPKILLHKVEEYLLASLDDFHIIDIGVICIGFFRGNTRFSSQDLVDAIANKLLTEMDSLEKEPYFLLNFLKMFRHASYTKVSFYERLADHLIESNFLSRYVTINPVMHIAFAYASLQVQHKPFFECLFGRIESLLPRSRKVRTKDISKFVWACGSLQFTPENYKERYGALVEWFEINTRNSRDYPESIVEFLLGLTYLGIFPPNLLHKCLSPVIVSRLLVTRRDREKSFQLFLLNESVKIECPEYKGNLVSQSQLKSLEQHPSVAPDLQRELQIRVGLLAAVSCLQRCLGVDSVKCFHPLVHFKIAVIELWYCTEQGFICISPSSTQQSKPTDHSGTVTHRTITDELHSAHTKRSVQPATSSTPSNVKRVAVLVSSRNHYALNDSQQAQGHLHTMKRQLQKVGYVVAEVVPDAALDLELSSHEERCHQLSECLSEALCVDIQLS